MRTFLFVAAAGAALFTNPASQAGPIFADDFNSYSPGNLVGQGPWTQTGTTATSPVQASSGAAALGTSGQDVYAAFSSAVTPTAGTSLFIGFDLTVSSAQATGDYFLHLASTVGGTSGFFDKLFAKSSGAGYVLGVSDNAGSITGTATTGTYGSTVLNFGTTYRVVMEEDFIAGDKNDTFELFVNPTDLTVAGNNSAYASFTWGSTASEAASYAELNFRQGSSTAASAETIDNLDVSQTFSDTSTFTPMVPEPSTFALLGLGAAAGFAFRRPRK